MFKKLFWVGALALGPCIIGWHFVPDSTAAGVYKITGYDGLCWNDDGYNKLLIKRSLRDETVSKVVNAMFGGTPHGGERLLGPVRLPGYRVTSCGFGGVDEVIDLPEWERRGLDEQMPWWPAREVVESVGGNCRSCRMVRGEAHVRFAGDLPSWTQRAFEECKSRHGRSTTFTMWWAVVYPENKRGLYEWHWSAVPLMVEGMAECDPHTPANRDLEDMSLREEEVAVSVWEREKVTADVLGQVHLDTLRAFRYSEKGKKRFARAKSLVKQAMEERAAELRAGESQSAEDSFDE
jgi:hypothetical protein